MRPAFRRLAALPLAAVLLVLGALPALSDPAGPTNYDSTVTGITPDVDGITAEVAGGDSFLVLTVANGQEVIVPGYEAEEQYVRFAPDGTVFVNESSRTFFQNEDRYAAAPIPDDAGPQTEPEWVQVATDGTYAWHDHRIHWMSPTPPDQVDTFASEPQPLFPWEVPLLVDGEQVTISGDLTWVPAPLPIVPIGIVVVALVGGVVLARRDLQSLATVVLVAGVAVLVTTLAARVGLPNGVQADARLLPPSIIAAAGPLLALVVRDRPERDRRILVGFGILGTIVVVALQPMALITSFVPSVLPAVVVRLLLGGALGLAIAGIVELVRGAVGSLPSLEPDPAP